MKSRDDLTTATRQHFEIIHESSKSPAHCLWLVAWSGGCDSSVLLDLCVSYARGAQLTIVTAHVDHKLRASSAQDAAFCEKVAATHPLIASHHTLEVEVASNTGSIQDAARLARWSALLELAARLDADAILTGHHLDDAIETLLLNGGRGAGVRGLSSMYAVSVPPALAQEGLSEHVMVHRPLIRSSRTEILTYARARGVKWVEDPTNSTDAYARNRVRHHVLPHLLEEHGGHAGWRRTLAILREEDAFIEAQVDALRQRAMKRDDPWVHAWSLDRGECVGAHSLLLTRLLIGIHASLPTTHPVPSKAHLEAFIAICRDLSRPSGHVAMPGLRVEIEPERLVVLYAPWRGSRGWFDEAQDEVEIVPGERTSGKVRWAGQDVTWRLVEDLPEEGEVLWCGVDDVDTARVVLRGGRPGERLEGRHLREGLRELRVPAWRRHLWPCLADDGGLISVRGWRAKQAISRKGPWIVLWMEK